MQTILDYFRRVAGYELWTVAVEIFLLDVFTGSDFLEAHARAIVPGRNTALFTGVLILNLISERYRFERLEYLYKGFLVGVLISRSRLSA